MRVTSVPTESGVRPAVDVDGQLYLWSQVGSGADAASVEELLPALCDGSATVDLAHARPLGDHVRPVAPLPTPRRDLICLGKNYAAHAEEFDLATQGVADLPTVPIVFTKATTTVCAHEDVVTVDPEVSREVDYEGELAVVIGRDARNIGHDEVFDHIAGYTIVNDLTARDLQHRHQQWFVGKSLDGFAPMGPVLVSKDEIPDPAALQLTTHVDGELRQDAPTSLMIFDVPYVVSFLSRVLTLQVGDILAMGTPKGVGIGFDPPRLLKDGSTVDVAISGIGRLTNTLRFASTAA